MSGLLDTIGDTAEVAPSFGASVRFQAPNGALVTVTIPPSGATLDREHLLLAARQAIAQLAAQAGSPAPAIASRNEIADCGAAFWSWASPQNA